MHRNYSHFALFILLTISSCGSDDDPVVADASHVIIEILPNDLGEQLDTDLVDFGALVTDSLGNNVDFLDIKWSSNHDGDLSNNQFKNWYFLSANEHVITCEVTLNNNSTHSQTVEVKVTDDPRGNWKIINQYNGAGNQIYKPDELALITDNFIIFSNTNDLTKRLIISDFAEQVLSELQTLYNIEKFDFNGRVVIGHQKETGNGFIGTSPVFSMYVGMPESGFVPLNGSWNFNIEGIKHELMHLVELSFLISSPSEITSHRWFWEGIAVLVSDGTRHTTWQQVQSWRSQYGGNPLSIKEQPTGTSSSDGHYYPMFGLSVAYLLDPYGLGKSYDDVILMYESIKQGATFETAFFTQFGISVSDYERNYYDIIEGYLN